ncbi:MAG: DUF4252 domain-containing protein [Bacteroidetes bacterium]|jgi:hypothetical protein|nr:DUF4252 domain-containing protein [Bacteroidota bacterium]
MKKLVLIFVMLVFAMSLNAQKSIDALFDRYAGNDDFVTITVSSNVFKLTKLINDCDNENDFFPPEITRIRIIVQEKKTNDIRNFIRMVEKEIDRKDYEEFMRIKKYDQDLVLFARSKGRNYKELLLIGGGEKNMLIQINGNMTYKDARKFAEKIRNNCDNTDLDIAWN